mmetsp:Transcript_550/g.1134  ORF Transcript_550/g.1134 Transcript_550/m.1134 type:complete len:376 (-) Transcript_550:191-1318(-)
MDSGTRCLQPAAVKVGEESTSSVRRVRLRAGCILDRRELLLPYHLEGSKVLGEVEHIEDKLLEFESIVFVWLKFLSVIICDWYLLLCKVMDESELCHILQKFASVKVHANVTRIVLKFTIGRGRVCDLFRHLRVFHYSYLAIDKCKYTYCLICVCLCHDLCTAVCLLLDAVPDEGGVCNLCNRIVDGVYMDELYSSLFHISKSARPLQCSVDASISIRCLCHTSSRLQEHIAIKIKARKGTLHEEEHILLFQSKVLVVFEKAPCLLIGGGGGHHIPRDNDILSGHFGRKLLHAAEALRLQLEEALARWKADIIHSLRVRCTQASALSASEEDQSHLAFRSRVYSSLPPLLCLLSSRSQLLHCGEGGQVVLAGWLR